MADPTPLNRNQIAAFVGNDPDAIRAIERLFKVAGQLTPADILTLTQLIGDVGYATGAADNKAEAALSQATDARQMADLLGVAAAQQDPRLDRLLDVVAYAPDNKDILQYAAARNRWESGQNPVSYTNVLLWLEAY
jgi:hypothetical protein